MSVADSPVPVDGTHSAVRIFISDRTTSNPVLRELTAVVVFVGLLGVAPGLVTADTGTGNATGAGLESQAGQSVPGPEIVELYPDPTTEGDRGEFVTVSLPPGTNLTDYELGDQQVTVSLSPTAVNRTDANVTDTTLDTAEPAARRVTFSTDPGLTGWLTDRTVAPLSDSLELANGGETVTLRRDGEAVDSAGYDQATEGEVYNTTTGGWESLGATDRPVVTAGPGTVEAFVLPDEPDRAVEFLDSATERVLLAGYTVSSQRVVEALVAALERGVTVEVLADGSPVGGITGEGVAALSELDRSGATVRVLAGERERFRYHHPKYAVVDDRALVTTENWKQSGTGGGSNRGWAVITGQAPIVEGLVETFRADLNWVDTVPWRRHDPDPVEDTSVAGDYPQTFEARDLPVNRTQLLVAPDNAGERIRAVIEGAEESVLVKQVGIGGRGFSLLQAVLDAAKRGVEVRILLSSAWYVEEENRQLAAWLTDQAAAADLPLSARLAAPGDAFGKIHAKGLVVDGEHTLVGSVNWNENSVRNNREVALLLSGQAVGGYFTEVFEADWQAGDGGERSIPLGIGLAVLAGAVLALLGAKRIRFDS
ncbi:MAG: phospholipase D [halophilic archaeon J07HX64]|nr:MAG: phospholipase D [halophilic archaeon J07HX64]